MSSIWRKYFIPHEGNEYRPHSLRGPTVAAVLLATLLLYGLSLIYPVILERTDFTAVILPAVLVDLANENRVLSGEPSLRVNPVLVEAAQSKANDMAGKGYFAHVSPEGVTPWHWFDVASYKFSYAGENLAVNFVDSEEVTKAWMNSPGHRANILNGKFTEIGIATAKGSYNGYETIFVVQLFGTPTRQIVQTTETVPPTKTETREIARKEVKTEAGREELYVEVEALPGETSTEPTSVGAPGAPPQYASEVAQALAAPNKILEYIYGALILLVLISLLLSIFIEIRRQHPKHIFYGVSLLVVLSFFVYATQSALLSPLIIR